MIAVILVLLMIVLTIIVGAVWKFDSVGAVISRFKDSLVEAAILMTVVWIAMIEKIRFVENLFFYVLAIFLLILLGFGLVIALLQFFGSMF